MMINQKRILLFDIDGTLLDPQGEGHIFMRRALEEVYGTAGPIDDYDMSGKTDWQIVTELMTLAGLAPDQISAQLEKAFAAYAYQISRAAPTLTLRLLPGALALLDWLSQEKGFLVGLLTGNVREAVPYKLRAAGMDPGLFQFGAYGSERLERNLLSALALERASQVLGDALQPYHALVIGDTPRDIASARHAGMKVLCAATGSYNRAALAAHEPDYLLDNLGDLEAVMGILSGF